MISLCWPGFWKLNHLTKPWWNAIDLVLELSVRYNKTGTAKNGPTETSSWLRLFTCRPKLQAVVYDILPVSGGRCRKATVGAEVSVSARSQTRPSLSGTRLQTLPDKFSYATEGVLFISAQLSRDAASALRKVRVLIKLQALVYYILPSTTAVFSYAIGPRKLSANEQFCCCCSNSNRFVTNNSTYIRRLFYNWPCCLHQLK